MFPEFEFEVDCATGGSTTSDPALISVLSVTVEVLFEVSDIEVDVVVMETFDGWESLDSVWPVMFSLASRNPSSSISASMEVIRLISNFK